MATTAHLPVLFNEVMDVFADKKIRIFLDGTLGAGGHAQGILERHPEIEIYVGIDQDPTALALAAKRLAPWEEKLQLVHTNFSDLKSIIKQRHIQGCDGILLDIGVSSMQLDSAERGFSINRPGPLDMRMNPSGPLTAEDIVNSWSEQDLGHLFRTFGEEKRWRAAAQAIVTARKTKALKTTDDLVTVLMPVLRDPRATKGIHPLTLVFQALRIAVNDELNVLKQAVADGVEALNVEGRLAVICFHSLEDRLVKQAFRYLASDKEDTHGIGGVFKDKEPVVKLVTRKALSASDEEVKLNPRARSARLRAVEKS